MDNRTIAYTLEKIALLLTIRRENPFKIRAFEKGARIVHDSSTSLQEMAEEGSLTNLEGIGKGIGQVIEELILTGKSKTLEELQQEIPDTIFELVEIPGTGPKKAAEIYNQTGIASLEDLERAIRGGSLSHLKGFGEKTLSKMLQGIEMRKQAAVNKSIGLTLPLFQMIKEKLTKTGYIKRISETGSVRRRTETAHSLEMICSLSEEKDIDHPKKAFLSLNEEVLSDNSTDKEIKDSHNSMSNSLSIVVSSCPVELAIVKDNEYAGRLFLSTGTPEHIEEVSQRLKQKGIFIKETGFANEEETLLLFKEEKEIYKAAGLQFIPPELRETGDFLLDFDTASPVPPLIEISHIRGDLQMHSHFSDGTASIQEMAEKGRSLGYSYIALTDHSKSLHIAGGLDKEKLKSQQKEIERLNHYYGGEFEIFKSAEVDILPDGSLDYDDETLDSLDFVLISIHMSMNMPKEKMTERVVKALSHPKVHCLAHPSGRLIGRRKEFDMDWDKVFEAAVKYGKALEINSHPARLDLNSTRCRQAASLGIPIYINTDAHSPEQMELMKYGVYTARKGGLLKHNILNTLSLHEITDRLNNRRLQN